ncbi:MAG: HEAT repeat domain-containing protein [Verrucomicrobiota bacterium]|nr:HEAT repeat domain-containing protein [Verrucomicrobiota bacterium]
MVSTLDFRNILVLKVFNRILGLYSNEGAHAFRFVRLALFWAFGSTCLETLSDGLFLEKVGANALPVAYLWSALGMIVLSTFCLRILRSVSPYRILLSIFLFGVLLALSTAFLVKTHPPPLFWYGLKISSRFFFTATIAISWTFIDQYHDLQDAKRLYSIYNASYFFGALLAGVMLQCFVEKLGFSVLATFAAASLLCALRETRSIVRKSKALHDDSSEGIFAGNRSSFASFVSTFLRSRFTILLLLLSLFMQLLLTVTEFNYMQVFDAHLHSSGEQAIAAFLGKCRAWIALGNIILGFFFYGRFIRKSGLHNAILITPLFFLMVYGGWSFADTLAIAVLGLVAADGVLWTVEDNCFNLLSNAVPLKIRSKVRIINDSFFEATGTFLSAILLFALEPVSRWLGLFLTISALVLAIGVRSTYASAILFNLKENAFSFAENLTGWLRKMGRRERREAKAHIVSALHSTSVETQLLAIDALLELADVSLIPALLRTLHSFSTASKIQFLYLLEKSSLASHPDLLAVITEWVREGHSGELMRRAHLFLAKQGRVDVDEALPDLCHPDPLLRASAILTCLGFSAHRERATASLQGMLSSDQIDEVAIALDLLAEGRDPSVVESLFPYLSSPALIVKRAAARCVARCVGETHVHGMAAAILKSLGEARDQTVRLSLLSALQKVMEPALLRELLLASLHFRPSEKRATEALFLQMGQEIVPLLLSLAKERSLPERARIMVSKTLKKLALPELQTHLFSILEKEIDRAYFYFYFGHTIEKQYPAYDLQMLSQALLSGYQSVIDFIIHFLGAAGSLEDPALLVHALQSRNAKMHSYAIESLERRCDRRIFQSILPLIDDFPIEEKKEACLRKCPHYATLSLSKLLEELHESSSLFDQAIAMRCKAELHLPDWTLHIQERLASASGPLSQYAHTLLETK